MIQTPMVALVSVGLWLMASRLDAQDGKPALLLAWLSRVATFVFMIFYTVLDSIGGSGLGALLLALAFFVAKRAPLGALVLLLVFGWELQMSHTMPHGPIAFAALIAAALWLRRGKPAEA